jgi:EAL domain-containing protein (putative c-di-GMP-specific phosphodiesterase class I)
VDLNSGEVIGAEALLRWQNSVLGQASLDEIIPIAGQTGSFVSDITVDPTDRELVNAAILTDATDLCIFPAYQDAAYCPRGYRLPD